MISELESGDGLDLERPKVVDCQRWKRLLTIGSSMRKAGKQECRVIEEEDLPKGISSYMQQRKPGTDLMVPYPSGVQTSFAG